MYRKVKSRIRRTDLPTRKQMRRVFKWYESTDLQTRIYADWLVSAIMRTTKHPRWKALMLARELLRSE
jgi:hypothetical protein